MPLLDSTHVGPVKSVHDLTTVSIWIKQDHLPLYIDGLVQEKRNSSALATE